MNNTHQEQEQEPNGIDIRPTKLKEVVLVSGLSKEVAHALWAITDINEKKEAILSALESLPYMKHENTINYILRTKKITDIDIQIANILLYSEEAAERINKKAIEKSNPLSLL